MAVDKRNIKKAFLKSLKSVRTLKKEFNKVMKNFDETKLEVLHKRAIDSKIFVKDAIIYLKETAKSTDDLKVIDACNSNLDLYVKLYDTLKQMCKLKQFYKESGSFTSVVRFVEND